MRARQVVSSVGAGGSLIAAGVCCLLVFSSWLAFHGWPGRAGAARDGRAALPAPDGKAAGRSASGPAPAPAAAAGTPRSTPRERAVGDRADRIVRRRTRLRPTGGAPGAAAPVTALMPAPAAGAGPAARTPAGGAARGGGGADRAGAGSTPRPASPGPVQRAVDTGHGVVERVVEPLPPPPPAVQGPIDAADDMLDGAARAVDDQLPPGTAELVP